MGVAANLGAKHEKKRRRKSNGDNICSLPTLIHKQTPSSYDCDVRISIVRLILSYLIIECPTLDKVGFRKGWVHVSLMQVDGVRRWFAIGCAWYRLIFYCYLFTKHHFQSPILTCDRIPLLFVCSLFISYHYNRWRIHIWCVQHSSFEKTLVKMQHYCCINKRDECNKLIFSSRAKIQWAS